MLRSASSKSSRPIHRTLRPRTAKALASSTVVAALWSVNSASGVVNSFSPGATFSGTVNMADPTLWSLGHIPTGTEEILIPSGGPVAGSVTMSLDSTSISGSVLTNLSSFGRIIANNGGSPTTISLSGISGQPTILNHPTNLSGLQFTLGGTTANNIALVLGSTSNEFRNDSIGNVFRVFADIQETTPGTNVSLTSYSGGSFEIGGNNSITGALTFAAPNTRVDLGSKAGSKLVASTGSLIFNGGTITIVGNGVTPTNHVVASTTVNAGTTQFVFAGNATSAGTFDFGAMSRNSGGAANFVTAPGVGSSPVLKTSTNNVNGILGGWATAQTASSGSAAPNNNAYDWAMKDGSGNIVPFTAYNTKNDLSTWATNDNINIDSATPTNSIGAVSINSLRTNVAGAYTLNTTGLLTVQSGGILIQNPTGALGTSLTFSSSGAITSGTTDLIIYTSGATKLVTISVPINDRTDGGGTHPVGVTKNGLNTLVITGADSYTGDVHINSGQLNIDAATNKDVASGLGINNTVYIGSAGSEATLNFGQNATAVVNGTTNRDIVLGAAGGNIRNQGPAGTVTFTGAITGGALSRFGTTGITIIQGTKGYTGSVTIGAGTLDVDTIANTGTPSGLGTGADDNRIFMGVGNASTLNFSGTTSATTDRPFILTSNTQNIRVVDANTNLTLTGAVNSASFSLLKQGAGTLTLTGAKSYAGTLSIGRGALSTNVITDRGTASGLGIGTFQAAAATDASTISLGVSNTATLSFTGTSGSTNRAFILGSVAGQAAGIEATTGSLTLNGGISGSGTLAFDGAGTVTVNGAITNTGNLVRNGTGTLILGSTANTYTGNTILTSGTLALASDSNLNTPATSITFNGGVLLTTAGVTSARPITVNAGGTIHTNGFDSTFSGPIVGTGNLTKMGTGVLTTNGVRSGGLVVSAGTLAIASGRDATNKVSNVGTISITAGAAVDLGANDLVYNYVSAGAGDPAARLGAIQQQLAAGYAGGAWTGTGLTSSAAKNDLTKKTALGFAEASAVGITGTYDGQAVDGDTIIVRYTNYGDANLNGAVTSADFTLLSNNFNATGANWGQGDFNFDGKVNAIDFNILAANFGNTPIAPGAALGTLVPEPASIAMLGVAMLGLRRRRREM